MLDRRYSVPIILNGGFSGDGLCRVGETFSAFVMALVGRLRSAVMDITLNRMEE